MRKAQATLGTAAFLAAAPGVVAGLVPWMLTGWRQGDSLWPPLRVAGAALVGVGAAVLLLAFAQFVVEGLGTPAPSAPTERLVVGGLYRYVRNPMYLAVIASIVGQAAILGSASLLVYAAILWVIVASFVLFYEEPVLGRRFGARYDDYRRGVPAWRPRLRPWRPQDT